MSKQTRHSLREEGVIIGCVFGTVLVPIRRSTQHRMRPKESHRFRSTSARFSVESLGNVASELRLTFFGDSTSTHRSAFSKFMPRAGAVQILQDRRPPLRIVILIFHKLADDIATIINLPCPNNGFWWHSFILCKLTCNSIYPAAGDTLRFFNFPRKWSFRFYIHRCLRASTHRAVAKRVGPCLSYSPSAGVLVLPPHEAA
jgi:hypothetical protein